MENPNQENCSIRPMVSIVVPVYNGLRNGLKECLTSLKKQNYSNFEIILVDDCSPDKSRSFSEDFLTGMENITIISNNKNLGLSRTWNIGISKAKGELLLLMHQDCALINDQQLSDGVRYLQDNEELDGLIGNQIIYFDRMGKPEKIMELRQAHLSVDNLEIDLTENKCDLIKKSTILKLGGFDEMTRNAGEDWLISLKLKERNSMVKQTPSFCYYDTLRDKSSYSGLIRKEFSYGMSMPLILFSKILKSRNKLHVNSSSLMGKKIRNRVFSLLPTAALICLILDLTLLKSEVLLSFILFLFIFRVLIVQADISKSYKAKLWDKRVDFSALVLSLMLDLTYNLGALLGIFNILKANKGKKLDLDHDKNLNIASSESEQIN